MTYSEYIFSGFLTLRCSSLKPPDHELAKIFKYQSPISLPRLAHTVEKMASLEIGLPPKMKATKVVWGALNEKLIVSYADGTIRTFDPDDGTELQYAQACLIEGMLIVGRESGGRREYNVHVSWLLTLCLAWPNLSPGLRSTTCVDVVFEFCLLLSTWSSWVIA